MSSLVRACIAEAVGTFLLVVVGTGVVAAAVLTGAQVGLWQVAVVWGIGVTLAIYATTTISGAHLNPAVSLAFALFRREEFPVSRLLPYCSSQLIGGLLAGLTILTFFSPFITSFEVAKGLVRGEPGSELSAMVFGEYFPNPAMFGTDATARALVSPVQAAAVEGFGAAVLVFVIFALMDRRNTGLQPRHLAPVFIGATIAVLISIFAPITQAGWNPARDLGPRIVAFFAGWGNVAIPAPENGFWAYIVGPLIGGPLGAALYDLTLRPAIARNRSSGVRVESEALEEVEVTRE